MRPPGEGQPVPGAWRHGLIAVLLLAAAAVLAVTSLLGDSATIDEPVHLTAGYVQLKTGDMRMATGHPPLARLWAALPLLAFSPALPDPSSKDFVESSVLEVGRAFLAQPGGDRLLTAGRCMIVLLLLATDAAVYFASKRLFGAIAALVSLGVAALSPALLAHGHLVTTDLPAALAALLVLLAFAAMLRRVTIPRLAGAAASLGLFGVTKFSWPVVLPSVALMGLFVALRRPPLEVGLPRRPEPVRLEGRLPRLAVLLFAGVVSGFAAWSAIWLCSGLTYSPFRWHVSPSVHMFVPPDVRRAAPTNQAEAWEALLLDEQGAPARGLIPGLVRWGRDRRILPESYLYGLALFHKLASPRVSYFRGEIRTTGRPAYFPVAFAIKTPIPTLLLIAAGLAALLTARAPRGREPALLLGLISFVGVYALFAVSAPLNIGHRHLLPLYPALAVLSGASVFLFGGRWRLVPAGLVFWLSVVTLRTHPFHLGYFNEFAGGTANGWRWLADSNLDWGQDLGRLARWLRARGNPEIKLAWFGVADPVAAGIRCEELPSYEPFSRPATLDPGLYVVSVNQMLGLYYPQSRDAFWDSAANRDYYEGLWWKARGSDISAEEEALFEKLRRARLLHALKGRPPDDRVGTSLFVFRLSADDLDGMLRP